MKNIKVFEVFKKYYDIEEIDNFLTEKCPNNLKFFKIYDDIFITFVEDDINHTNILEKLDIIDKSIIKTVDAKIIVVSDTTDTFKKSECYFENGDNLCIDFLLHQIYNDRYVAWYGFIDTGFRKVLKPIMKELNN